jgi:hypothetical protein
MKNTLLVTIPFSHSIDVSSLIRYETMECNGIDGRGLTKSDDSLVRIFTQNLSERCNNYQQYGFFFVFSPTHLHSFHKPILLFKAGPVTQGSNPFFHYQHTSPSHYPSTQPQPLSSRSPSTTMSSPTHTTDCDLDYLDAIKMLGH